MASKFEAMRAALELARIGLRDWEDPETRYKALRAIDAALALPDDEPVVQERDALAKAIHDAAVSAGIINSGHALTGPQLIMLCNHLGANNIAPQPPVYDEAREREEFEDWQRREYDTSDFRRSIDGCYTVDLLQDEWKAWKAGRAALRKESK